MISSNRIPQGTNRIVKAYDIVDDDEQPLTVDGWTVEGVARCNHADGEVLTEWSTTPGVDQGQATAAGREVQLLITPVMSAAWNCHKVCIQAEMTSPDGAQTERIIDRIFYVDREAVRA